MPYRDPRPEELTDPLFNAIWEVTKDWDVRIPKVHGGYTGMTGNCVCVIMDAVRALAASRVEPGAGGEK